MACEHLTLQAGDALYLPAGMVHHAATTEAEGSVHVTYRMLLEGHRWIDELDRQCLEQYTPTMCAQLRGQLDADATMFAWYRLKNDTTSWPSLPVRFAAIAPESYGYAQLDSRGAAALSVDKAGLSRQVDSAPIGQLTPCHECLVC